MDDFLLRPSLKETDQAAAVGSVDHLFAHSVTARLTDGHAQTRRLVNTLQTCCRCNAQAVFSQRKYRFKMGKAGRFFFGCIHKRYDCRHSYVHPASSAHGQWLMPADPERLTLALLVIQFMLQIAGHQLITGVFRGKILMQHTVNSIRNRHLHAQALGQIVH